MPGGFVEKPRIHRMDIGTPNTFHELDSAVTARQAQKDSERQIMQCIPVARRTRRLPTVLSTFLRPERKAVSSTLQSIDSKEDRNRRSLAEIEANQRKREFDQAQERKRR